MLLPLLAGIAGPLVLGRSGKIPAHFVFHDFQQRDISGTETGNVRDHGPTGTTAARVELADAT
ncbi:MAG: hypothetical protein JWQ71_4642 [Pedosphaera sp.]|nr:hypothetical protein [Pedosphaera sp.]